MIAGFVLGLREGLEAALILGVTFGVLRRTRRMELAPAAWLGIALASILSVVGAVILLSAGRRLEGVAEAAFEGVTMLLAAGVLTWMILWMSRQGRSLQTGLEREVEQAALRRQAGAVLGIAFLSVLREGIETALFLSAAAFQDNQTAVVVGGGLGILTAGFLGWGLYRTTIQLDLRQFFRFTGLLLILFAAGLAAHGVHELVGAGWLPGLVDPIYSVESLVGEGSLVGLVLKTLFGYNSEPTLLEMIAYVLYFVGVGAALRFQSRDNPTPIAAAG